MSKRVDIKGVIQERLQDAPFVGALIMGTTCNQNCANCFNQHLKNRNTLNVNPKFIIDMIQLNPFNEGVIFGGLEWCTHSYNNEYSLSKKINQYNKDNVFIKTWSSARKIERELLINHSDILKCCKGLYKQAGGFIWKFEGVL